MKYYCPECYQDNFSEVIIPEEEMRKHLIDVHRRRFSNDESYRVWMITWKPEVVK